jgi:hypothetical protein
MLEIRQAANKAKIGLKSLKNGQKQLYSHQWPVTLRQFLEESAHSSSK